MFEFSKTKRRNKIRQKVLERDGSACIYCLSSLSDAEITLDHIIPDSQGGGYCASNLTIACSPCNTKRGTIPFFEFIERFHFDEEKVKKFIRLFHRNLQIKRLNQAKLLIKNDFEVPQKLLDQASLLFELPVLRFDEHLFEVPIVSFDGLEKRRDIIHTFEIIIKRLDKQ